MTTETTKTEKVCTRCRRKLPVEMFTMDNRAKDHLSLYCRLCYNTMQKESIKKRHINEIEFRKANPINILYCDEFYLLQRAEERTAEITAYLEKHKEVKK